MISTSGAHSGIALHCMAVLRSRSRARHCLCEWLVCEQCVALHGGLPTAQQSTALLPDDEVSFAPLDHDPAAHPDSALDLDATVSAPGLLAAAADFAPLVRPRPRPSSTIFDVQTRILSARPSRAGRRAFSVSLPDDRVQPGFQCEPYPAFNARRSAVACKSIPAFNARNSEAACNAGVGFNLACLSTRRRTPWQCTSEAERNPCVALLS